MNRFHRGSLSPSVDFSNGSLNSLNSLNSLKSLNSFNSLSLSLSPTDSVSSQENRVINKKGGNGENGENGGNNKNDSKNNDPPKKGLLNADSLSESESSENIIQPKSTSLKRKRVGNDGKNSYGDEEHDYRTIKKWCNMALWQPERYKKTFVLPVEGSILMIRVENIKDRNIKTRSSKTSFTHWIYGIVKCVKQINAESIIIEGLYVERVEDVKKVPEKLIKLIRVDQLDFNKFGEKKLWFVLSTPEHILIKNKLSEKKMTMLQEIVKDQNVDARTVNTNEEPLAFCKSHQKTLIGDIACEKCGCRDEKHPKYGDMLICDICDSGWHKGCIPGGSAEDDYPGDWACIVCQPEWDKNRLTGLLQGGKVKEDERKKEREKCKKCKKCKTQKKQKKKDV